MAIANNDDYVGSAKQVIEWMRSVTRTTVIGGWFTLFELAGQPGPGTLAAGNTASGVVHDDAIAGVAEQTTAQALRELRASGVRFTTASEL